MNEFEKELMAGEDLFLKEINPPRGDYQSFPTITFTIGRKLPENISDNFLFTDILKAQKYTAEFIQRLMMHQTEYIYTMDAIVDIRIPWSMWNDPAAMIINGLIPYVQVVVTRKLRLSQDVTIDPTEVINYFDIISYYSGICSNTPWHDPELKYRADDWTDTLLVPRNYKAQLAVNLLNGSAPFAKVGQDYIFKGEERKYVEIKNKPKDALNEGLVNLYTHGQCIRFAALLKTILGMNAIPLWMTKRHDPQNDGNDHMFTYYCGRFYDATGSYTWNQLGPKWIVVLDKGTTNIAPNTVNVLNFSSGYSTKYGIIEAMFGKDKV